MAITRHQFGFVLCLLAMLHAPLLAKEKFQTEAEIRTLLRDYVEKEKRSPGIVVGIVDGKGAHVFSHGKVRADSEAKVNGDSIFQIGSVTKTFTTLLLQRMVDRGEVKLDEPVANLLPASAKIPSRNGREITLRDLATHRSGLPRMPFKKPPPPGAMPSVTMEQVFEFLADYELTRDIGSQYEYSNLGVALLAHALALKARTDYEALLVKEICEPLKMKDTRIKLTPKLKKRIATGHSRADKPMAEWHQPTLLGAGAICSSANDMVKYLSAQLGLTKSPLHDAMKKTQAPQAKAIREMQVALGWHVRKFDGAEIVTHNGSTLGYHSSMVFDPVNRRGVIVLVNSANEIGELPFTILKQLSAQPNVTAEK